MTKKGRPILAVSLILAICVVVLSVLLLPKYKGAPSVERTKLRSPSLQVTEESRRQQVEAIQERAPKMDDLQDSTVEHLLEEEEQYQGARLKLLGLLPQEKDGASPFLPVRSPKFPDVYPSISQDGKRVTFVGQDGFEDNEVDVYVYSFEDETFRNVTKTFGNPHKSLPRISPDWRKVAFCSIDGIWTVDVESGKFELVISGGPNSPERATCPSWSPDARYIAYETLERAGLRSFRGSVHIYDLQSRTVVKTIAAGQETIYSSPCFSYDGKQLLYRTSEKSEGDQKYKHSLVLESLESGEKRVLSIPQRDFGGAKLSPDGNYVAYNAVVGDTGISETFLFRLEDGIVQQVTFGSGSAPYWLPDSRRLVFTSPRRTGVQRTYSIPIAGQ